MAENLQRIKMTATKRMFPTNLIQMILRLAAVPTMIAIAILMSGCSSVKTPVPVYGGNDDINSLTGEWYGEYESREAGRHGGIYFTLETEADSAVGFVIMKPGSFEDELFDREKTLSSMRSEMLTIRFVSIGKGHVVGRLDEYKDPNCGCMLETIFEGHLSGDRIEGVYTSHGDVFHMSTSGEWWVERRPSTTAMR